MADDAYDTKAKYMLMYARDVTQPPNHANTEMKLFRSWPAFLWFLARSRAARAAIHRDRFQFATIKEKA